MAQPFMIRPPLELLQAFGNNLPALAQAAREGRVSALEATLAAQKFHQLEAAERSAQVPTQTIAQQLFNPQVPSPPMGGIGAPSPIPVQGVPAGLGATPEAVQMQEPMPEMPMEEAPMGMAAGGLTSLSIPDDMFDEPNNGGYANGGLVAFSNGGGIDAARLRAALRAQESGGDYGVMNAEGSGAMGAYQFMPDTARALAARIGMEYRPDLMSGKGGRSKEGRAYQERLMDEQMKDIMSFAGNDIGRAGVYHFAGPNEKGWGAKTRQYEKDILRRYSGSKDTGEIPERDSATASGRAGSYEDAMALAEGSLSGLPRKALERAMAAAEEKLDPDNQAKEVEYDKYKALAVLGFNIATLPTIADAAKATLPEIEASKKEREAAKNAAIRDIMAVEDVDRKTAMAKVELGTEIFKSGLTAAQAARAIAFQERELASRIAQAGLDRASAERIASMRTSNPTEFESMMAIVLNGSKEEKDALNEVIKMKRPPQGPLPGDTGGASGMDLSQWGTPTVVTQ